jgi:hypothetical protein
MRQAAQIQQSIREKLLSLRKAARASEPTVSGSPSERKAKAVKGFIEWADLRNQANKAGSR